MLIWIVAVLVLLAGLGAVVFGLWRYAASVGRRGRARRVVTVAGLLIPTVLALYFSSMLFALFPGLTVVDAAALFAAGAASGFFLGAHAVAARLGGKREV